MNWRYSKSKIRVFVNVSQMYSRAALEVDKMLLVELDLMGGTQASQVLWPIRLIGKETKGRKVTDISIVSDKVS